MTRPWLIGGLVAAVLGFAGAYTIGSAGGEDSAPSRGGSVEVIDRSLATPTAAGLESAPALPALRRPARTDRPQTSPPTTTPPTITPPPTTTPPTTVQPPPTVKPPPITVEE